MWPLLLQVSAKTHSVPPRQSTRITCFSDRTPDERELRLDYLGSEFEGQITVVGKAWPGKHGPVVTLHPVLRQQRHTNMGSASHGAELPFCFLFHTELQPQGWSHPRLSGFSPLPPSQSRNLQTCLKVCVLGNSKSCQADRVNHTT